MFVLEAAFAGLEAPLRSRGCGCNRWRLGLRCSTYGGNSPVETMPIVRMAVL